MEVTLKSTDKMVTLVVPGGEVHARIWEGHTRSGIRVHAYMTRIAVKSSEDQTDFMAELNEHEAPSAEIAAIPVRLVL